MNNLPKTVEIVDVSPRDGLQMLPGFVPTRHKIELIELLKSAGIKRIEAVSFVSPKHVPQMSDAAEVIAAVGNDPNVAEVALALNERGMKDAVRSGVDWITYVIAATESMASKNANTTVFDGLEMCKKAIQIGKENGIKVRGSISVTWVCPYEGDVPQKRVIDLTKELVDAGADEIAFNDTVGRAVPNDVYELCSIAKQKFPDQQFAAHFHDTFSTALANIYASLTAGWEIFDSSAGGLGGCPFSPGATGNIATEKVVWMLHKMGIETGIDPDKLSLAVSYALNIQAAAVAAE